MVEASHNMQKYDQKSFAVTQELNSNFLELLVDHFKNLLSQKLEELFTSFKILELGLSMGYHMTYNDSLLAA